MPSVKIEKNVSESVQVTFIATSACLLIIALHLFSHACQIESEMSALENIAEQAGVEVHIDIYGRPSFSNAEIEKNLLNNAKKWHLRGQTYRIFNGVISNDGDNLNIMCGL